MPGISTMASARLSVATVLPSPLTALAITMLRGAPLGLSAVIELRRLRNCSAIWLRGRTAIVISSRTMGVLTASSGSAA